MTWYEDAAREIVDSIAPGGTTGHYADCPCDDCRMLTVGRIENSRQVIARRDPKGGASSQSQAFVMPPSIAAEWELVPGPDGKPQLRAPRSGEYYFDPDAAFCPLGRAYVDWPERLRCWIIRLKGTTK